VIKGEYENDFELFLEVPASYFIF